MSIATDWTIDTNAYTITYVGNFDADGVPNNIYTVNALYSWLQEEFDEPAYMDDPVPMSAQTPVEYTLLAPWFIPDESMRALYEGSIQTSGWTRVEDSVTGIVQVLFSGATAPTSDDLGLPVVHEVDSDAGTLVGFDNVRKMLWIRPDTDAIANSFNSTSGNLDVTGGTQDIVQAAAAETGESIWHCFYSLGSIQNDTEIFVYQIDEFTEVATPSYTRLGPWWYDDVDFSAASGVVSGHVDLLVKVQELSALIDEGRVLFGAKQYSRTFSHYDVTVTGSGRTPIPLATLDDLNNESGHRQFISDADSGTWTQADVGEVFRLDGGGTRQTAIMTSLSGTSPNWTVQYYLIGKQEDFSDDDVIENEAETRTMTIAGAPTDVGPAAQTSITLTFGATTGDIDEDGTDEQYSAELDCNNTVLSTVYERMKYLTRMGAPSDIDSGGQLIPGEYYRGVGDYYIPYDNSTTDPPFTEGEVITGPSAFEAIITSAHDMGTSEGFLVVRQSRGTLVTDNDLITGADSGDSALVDTNAGADPIEAITEVPQAPIGTFAGGKFFLARGIKPINVPSADASNYQCIDSYGTVVDPPVKVTVEITGLSAGDRGVIMEVDAVGSTTIVKNQHGLAAGNNEGNTTVVVDSAIPVGTPGKTTGGVIRCVDDSDLTEFKETRYRFASWTGSTFTLETGITAACEAGGSGTLLVDTGIGSGDIEAGDRIHNVTDDSYATVLTVNANNLVTTQLLGGTDNTWANGDTYQSNQLDRNYDGAADEAYVPLVDGVATGDSLSSSIEYPGSTIPIIVRVRWAGTEPILPFQQTGLSVISTGRSVAAIRTDDTIKS
jgi:hypothetical protein